MTRHYITLLVTFLTVFSTMHAQDADAYYWYEHGKKVHWAKQTDVVAFKLQNADDANFLSQRSSNAAVTVKPLKNSFLLTITDKGGLGDLNALKITAQSNIAGAKELPVITQFIGAKAADNKWVVADDRLLIRLKPGASASLVEQIFSDKGLKAEYLDNDMVIADAGSASKNAIELSASLYEEYPALFASVTPNRLEFFKPHSNDTYIDQAWHLNNTGQNVFCNNKSGVASADARVSAAWGSGYKGQSVNIGIIDFYGFDYDHPDLSGRIGAGWDCIQNKPYTASDFYFTDAANAHGTAVAGIVSAAIDNNEGAAGVAPHSTIIPLLMDGSEASVIIALQKAVELGVDVVNMSFGSYYNSQAIYDEVKNCVTQGREMYGSLKGCVFIASSGNDYKDDAVEAQYPAAYEEVISVGASTPGDKRKQPNDGWDSGNVWGSNYGDLIDVVAPGVCLFTTDISGADGYSSSSDYIGFYMTSAAAPLVSGVAALILSKNPSLSWQEVQTKIRNGVDKVGSYDYSYDSKKPGHSREMGYGRINAQKALDSTPVGIEQDDIVADASAGRYMIAMPVTGNLRVYANNTDGKEVQLTITDISGKLVNSYWLNSYQSEYNLDIRRMPAGMYLAHFNDGAKVSETVKFIKVR